MRLPPPTVRMRRCDICNDVTVPAAGHASSPATAQTLMHELNVSLSDGEDVMVPKTFVEDAEALREPSEAEKSNK